MSFFYETHAHTVEASACGRMPGRDYPAYMKGLGYDGMIITDHFFNGNSRVPRDLPWEERIAMYCSGYEAAAAAAQESRLDFRVFFGVEFNFQGDEYLLYGIDRDWLIQHPEIMQMNRKELYEAVHAAGGIMVQAHPYRERGYLSDIYLFPDPIDGAEVYNAANQPYQNALAYQYAQEHGLRMSGGSDIHFVHDEEKGGLLFEHRLDSMEDFISAFLAGEGKPACLDQGKLTPVEDLAAQTIRSQEAELPVHVMTQ